MMTRSVPNLRRVGHTSPKPDTGRSRLSRDSDHGPGSAEARDSTGNRSTVAAIQSTPERASGAPLPHLNAACASLDQRHLWIDGATEE